MDRRPTRIRRTVGDVPDLAPTLASETPTSPSAPVPGVALDPSLTTSDESLPESPIEDALSALQQRDHPFP